MIMRLIRFLSIALLLCMTTVAHAQQTGILTGTVTEASSGDQLIGASLVLDGTTRGTASDMNGNFTIRNITPGVYTLVVSYIGYDRQRIEIEIEAGEELRLDIELAWSGVSGDEVLISAQARGQTSAINEQVRSRTITNIVSSERIRELPDDNAATALSRLPGVSLQDGDKVVIRGMEAKLNTISVNGIQLPSTSLEDRSTNLGFISSNMLDGIEVSKSVTSDMDANSTGGAVNLRLRQAPKGLNFDVMSQGTYNTQNQTYGNYQGWASVSNRFADDKIGVFLQGNIRRFDGGGDFGNAIYERMGQGSDPGYGLATYGMQQFEFGDDVRITEEMGGSLLLDYQLPNGKLVLQNTYAFTDNDLTRHMDILFLNDGQRQFRTDREVNYKHLVINALQGEHFFLDDIKLDYGLSHAHSQLRTDLMYGIEFAGPSAFEPFSQSERMALTAEDIYQIQASETHWQTAGVNNGSTRDQSFDERQMVASVNLTIPFEAGIFEGNFKTGGKYAYMNRVNDVQRQLEQLDNSGRYAGAREYLESLGINPDSRLRFGDIKNFDYTRGENFLGGNYTMSEVSDTEILDNFFRLASAEWRNHQADTYRFDFDAQESISAAYFMADFDIGANLSLTAGVRYEYFDMDYESHFVSQSHWLGDGQIMDTLNTATRSYGNFFPNVQARYKITDWMDVRAAYTQTIARPDYNQLMPNIFVDRGGGAFRGQAGNPDLKPALADNFDLHFSFYNNEVGLLTIGGFYKVMENVILSQSIQRRHLEDRGFTRWPDPTESDLPNIQASDRVDTFLNNPNAAEVYGFELDWQTNFWYLPEPFNSIVFNANYTRVFSEMDYQQIRNITSREFDPVTGGFVTTVEMVDTLRTARLLQQGDNIINLALGADIRGFSGRVSFRLQGDVITSVGSRPETDTFTGDVYGWDFTIRQQLPVEGLTVFLNGMNITHVPVKNYQNFRRDADLDAVNNLSRTTYYPRRFELGARFSF